VKDNQFLFANFYKDFDLSIEDEIWNLGLLVAEMMLGHPLYSLDSTEFIRENPVPVLEANVSNDLLLLTESMLFKIPAFRPSLSEILKNPLFSSYIERPLQEQRELIQNQIFHQEQIEQVQVQEELFQEQIEVIQEEARLNHGNTQNAEIATTNERSNFIFSIISFFFLPLPSFVRLILIKFFAFIPLFFAKSGLMIMRISCRVFQLYYPILKTISYEICEVFDKIYHYFFHIFKEHLDRICDKTAANMYRFYDQLMMSFSFFMALLPFYYFYLHSVFRFFIILTKHMLMLTLKFSFHLFSFIFVFHKQCYFFILFPLSCAYRMIFTCIYYSLKFIRKIILLSVKAMMFVMKIIKLTLKCFWFCSYIVLIVVYVTLIFPLILFKKIFCHFLFSPLSIVFFLAKITLISFVSFIFFYSFFLYISLHI
jgi:hypothetical protein